MTGQQPSSPFQKTTAAAPPVFHRPIWLYGCILHIRKLIGVAFLSLRPKIVEILAKSAHYLIVFLKSKQQLFRPKNGKFSAMFRRLRAQIFAHNFILVFFGCWNNQFHFGEYLFSQRHIPFVWFTNGNNGKNAHIELGWFRVFLRCFQTDSVIWRTKKKYRNVSLFAFSSEKLKSFQIYLTFGIWCALPAWLQAHS